MRRALAPPMVSALVSSCQDVRTHPSSHTTAIQTCYFRKGNLGIDQTNDEIIRNKLLSFDYSKHHKTRPHHAYTNAKTLWSDVGRQMLTKNDLPILQRLEVEEERRKEEMLNKSQRPQVATKESMHKENTNTTESAEIGSLASQTNDLKRVIARVVRAQKLLKSDKMRDSLIKAGLLKLLEQFHIFGQHPRTADDLQDANGKFESIEDATARLLACVLLAEGLSLLSTDAINQKRIMFEIQSLIVDSVLTFLDLFQRIDAEDEAIQRLRMQGSIFCSYLLTDPLVTATSAADVVLEVESSLSSSSPQDSHKLSEHLIDLVHKSDSVVCTLLSEAASALAHSDTSASSPSSSSPSNPLQVNLHALFLMTKAAATFAISTEIMDGNEFYAQILSAINNSLNKEIRLLSKEIANVHLKTVTDGFGNKKRNTVLKDFPIPFYKIRLLVDAARWVSKIIETHYAHADSLLLRECRSAISSRQRTETAVLKLLSLVPNAFIDMEHETIQRWMAVVGPLAEMANEERSSFLLLSMRVTALAPQDGEMGYKYDLLDKLLELKDTKSLTSDERNWRAQSIRNTLKSLGASDFSAALSSLDEEREDSRQRILERINTILASAHAVRFLPVELWRSISLGIIANATANITSTRSTSSDIRVDVSQLAKKLIDMRKSQEDSGETGPSGFIPEIDAHGVIYTKLKGISANSE